MTDLKITDEFVRNVRDGIKIVTYLLRHPNRLTSNTCGEMRDARRALEELLDQILIIRADLEHMTPEQREAYISSEGRVVQIPQPTPIMTMNLPGVQSPIDADDIPF